MRILILSASVGAGHLRAAEALELAARELLPEAKVVNLDVLTLASRAFRRAYGDAYLDLVNKAPHLLGYLYDALDRPSRSGHGRRDRLRGLVEKLSLLPFRRFLLRAAPDLVLNTHFLPASIVASLRRDGRIEVRQAIVTTDFDVHRLWIHDPCELYFAASEEGVTALASWGVEAERIALTGVPIHPRFARRLDRYECRRRHGLDPARPLVLQLAGGFGVGPIEEIYRRLLEVPHPVQVVVVAGRNQEVRERLLAVPVPSQQQAKVLGFTTDMDELMAAADLLVSKPGGLTSSEALARGLPMIAIEPIPGQETRNADYLLERGAALRANSLAQLGRKAAELLGAPARLAGLAARARALARPRAAYDVITRAIAP